MKVYKIILTLSVSISIVNAGWWDDICAALKGNKQNQQQVPNFLEIDQQKLDQIINQQNNQQRQNNAVKQAQVYQKPQNNNRQKNQANKQQIQNPKIAEQQRIQQMNNKLQYFAQKYQINQNLCKPSIGIAQEIFQGGKLLGQGAYGKVAEYRGKAYKFIQEYPLYKSIEIGLSEIEHLLKFQQHNQNGKSLFQSDIDCYYDYYANKYYLIIQQQLVGQDLDLDKKIGKLGGQYFMEPSQIKQNIDFRFQLYSRLFETLIKYEEESKVHRDIKPSNIVANINLRRLSIDLATLNPQKKQEELEKLQLMIIDYGHMVNEGDSSYGGTVFYMHPSVLAGTYPDATTNIDVYSLALSISQIETYSFRNGYEYLFQKYNGNVLETLAENWIIANNNNTQDTLRKVVNYTKKMMDDYIQRFINAFCHIDQQSQIIQKLQTFSNQQNKSSFYKDVCGQCYACVLASTFQVDLNNVPTAKEILDGFLQVSTNRMPNDVKTIGKGSFGYAVLVRHKMYQDKFYVMKMIDIKKMTQKQREEACNEIKILKSLNNPFIIKYRESFEEKNVLCIVMDFANGGDLYNMINYYKNKNMYIPENIIIQIFTEICIALSHVHQNKILHRDLKTQNIFLTKQRHVKLGDFGISRVLQHTYDKARTAIGTPYYLSPEICEEKPYNHKSDVWSVGCILYEMMSRTHAFDALSMKVLVIKILNGKYPPPPQHYSENLKILLKSLLQRDPDKRPSIEQILHFPGIYEQVKILEEEYNMQFTQEVQQVNKQKETQREIEKSETKEKMVLQYRSPKRSKNSYQDEQQKSQRKKIEIKKQSNYDSNKSFQLNKKYSSIQDSEVNIRKRTKSLLYDDNKRNKKTKQSHTSRNDQQKLMKKLTDKILTKVQAQKEEFQYYSQQNKQKLENKDQQINLQKQQVEVNFPQAQEKKESANVFEKIDDSQHQQQMKSEDQNIDQLQKNQNKSQFTDKNDKLDNSIYENYQKNKSKKLNPIIKTEKQDNVQDQNAQNYDENNIFGVKKSRKQKRSKSDIWSKRNLTKSLEKKSQLLEKREIERDRPKTPGQNIRKSTKNKSKKILFEFLSKEQQRKKVENVTEDENPKQLLIKQQTNTEKPRLRANFFEQDKNFQIQNQQKKQNLEQGQEQKYQSLQNLQNNTMFQKQDELQKQQFKQYQTTNYLQSQNDNQSNQSQILQQQQAQFPISQENQEINKILEKYWKNQIFEESKNKKQNKVEDQILLIDASKLFSDLPIEWQKEDSQYYKIEAVKAYIEKQIGVLKFLQLYKKLIDEQTLEDDISMVDQQYIPLITQLIYLEENAYNNN